MKRIIFFLFAISLLTISCKKNQDDVAAPGPAIYSEGTLADSTIIVNTDSCYSSLLSVDSLKITFKDGGSGVGRIKVGSILVSDITPKSPYGFLRKVTSITVSGGKKICKTTQATIAEALNDGKVGFHKSFDDSDIIGIDSSGNDVGGKTSGTQSLSFKLSFQKTISDVKVSGEVELEPSMDFNFETSHGEVSVFKSVFVLKKTKRLAFEATNPGHIGKEWVLGVYSLRPFTIFIGPFPIPIKPWVVVVAGVDGEIKAKLISDISATSTVSSGMEYSNRSWKTIHDQQETPVKNKFSTEAEAKAEASLQGRLELRAFGLRQARVFVAAKGSVIIKTEAPTPCSDTVGIALKTGLNLSAKAQMDIFGYSIADFDATIFDDEYPLYRLDTCFTETFTDPRDGEKYKIKKFGTQTWMIEDLRFRQGQPLPADKTRPYFYAEFANQAPPGWHVPSISEWTVLINYFEDLTLRVVN